MNRADGHSDSILQDAEKMQMILGLSSFPAGVFFLREIASPFDRWQRAEGCRFCQALMEARQGASLLLDGKGLSCPAAARTFGFRPLPKALAEGDGLVGFGIVSEAASGKNMFEQMPHLAPDSFQAVALCPLQLALATPDVVVVEGLPEQLMWLLLADLNLAGGQRRTASTAVLQATCVDATLIPYLEKRMNFSLGCYGCREATDLETAEAVLGFPGERLHALMDRLSFLSEKAIPHSRAKSVYLHFSHNQEKTPDLPSQKAAECGSAIDSAS